MQDQGQGHRPKAKTKAENAKVTYSKLSWFQATAAITTAIK